MTKADKHKSQNKKQDDDVIEGDATIIEEETKTSSQKERAKKNSQKSSSTVFPKLAFGAMILAILSLAATIYMGLMVGALKTELAGQKSLFEQAQSDAQQSQIEALDSLAQSQANIDQISAKISSDFTKLAGEVESLKEQIADRDRTSLSSSSAPLELSVVMMIWAEASHGQRLDRFAPIVNSLPASQTKTSLLDSLALAGDSTHESLMRRAMRPQKIYHDEAIEETSSGLWDGVTSWLGDVVKLRPVAAPAIEEVSGEKQSRAASSSDAQALELTTLDSLYAHHAANNNAGDDLASWLIEAKARLEADKALTSLLQMLISDEIKG